MNSILQGLSFFKIMQFLIPFCQNFLKKHIMVRHNTQHAFLIVFPQVSLVTCITFKFLLNTFSFSCTLSIASQNVRDSFSTHL